jgi:hypothetical protein
VFYLRNATNESRKTAGRHKHRRHRDILSRRVLFSAPSTLAVGLDKHVRPFFSNSRRTVLEQRERLIAAGCIFTLLQFCRPRFGGGSLEDDVENLLEPIRVRTVEEHAIATVTRVSRWR